MITIHSTCEGGPHCFKIRYNLQAFSLSLLLLFQTFRRTRYMVKLIENNEAGTYAQRLAGFALVIVDSRYYYFFKKKKKPQQQRHLLRSSLSLFSVKYADK